LLQAADVKAPVDSRVVDHVNYLVDNGIFNVGELKRNVRLFVKQLLRGQTLPSLTVNRHFYPSRLDLRNMVYRQRQRCLQGLLDQEVVEKKVEHWKVERPDDTWIFRPSSSDSDAKTSLLLFYQAKWQRRLLSLYGQDITFLDATYKTTRYAVPLFFLSVQTNCGYVVVGAFCIEREDTSSLTEALEVLREHNPDWCPRAFMTDASEVEINAIRTVFPGIANSHYTLLTCL
jgi:hypothetical protein